MTAPHKQIPSKQAVWSGAILGCIVNATMTASDKSYAAFRQWDGNTYFLDGGDGRLGAITFEEGHISNKGHLVGVFFFSESDQSPWMSKVPYDLERFFRGCPPRQRAMADQAALPYLLMEDDGKTIPLVTAVFWDEGSSLAASVTWDKVVADGANLITTELINDPVAALAKWKVAYGMSSEQILFADALFRRKMANPDLLIRVSNADAEWLLSISSDPAAVMASLQQFTAIGIDVSLGADTPTQ